MRTAALLIATLSLIAAHSVVDLFARSPSGAPAIATSDATFVVASDAATRVMADPASAPQVAPVPSDIDRRIPWTGSRIVGSPDPPLPYRVARAYPKLPLNQPIYVIAEPGTDYLMLVSTNGGPTRIARFKSDPAVDRLETVLDLNRLAYAVAFHPNYVKNGYIYTCSNGPVGAAKKFNRLSRYTVDRQPPYRCDPKSEQVILEWHSDGHNGSDLAFGPDGMLYVTSGDGTSDSDGYDTGQNLTDLLATVLRIDVDRPADGKPYSVPKDNPFVDVKDARPEIWAYGFRNPWRMSFDRKTGQLWVGNNGQDLWETAYLVRRGENYGWSAIEGTHPFQLHRKPGPTPFSKPAVEHPHSEARSLTGGVVYYGTKLPDLVGAYIYGDYSTGRIWGVRHDGTRATWHKELTDTSLQIVGFGSDHDGELLVVDHGGGLYRLEPTPKNPPGSEPRPADFPRRLSETGLFASVRDHQPDPALIPYSVNAPLWSDGAIKERFIALPGTSQIDFTSSRGWNFSDGAVLVKTFSLDREHENPATRRRIETRLLTRQQGEWQGYTYLWNDEQTDAELVASAGVDREFSIRDASAPGGVRKQTWHYPSRAECMVCHSRAANFVLGLSTLQMNKTHDYGMRGNARVVDNQLRRLERIGAMRVNPVEHVKEIDARAARAEQHWDESARQAADRVVDRAGKWFGLPTGAPTIGRVRSAFIVGHTIPSVAAPAITYGWDLARSGAVAAWDPVRRYVERTPSLTRSLPAWPLVHRRLVDPSDPRQDLGDRMRSYLHGNCSQCHVEAGGGNSLMELEFTTNRNKTRAFDVRPQHHTFGMADAKIIAPGHPERSVLAHRMSIRGAGQMPPLATSIVDEPTVKLLHEWIRRQSGAPVEDAPKPK